MFKKLNQKCISLWTLILFFAMLWLRLTPVLAEETKGCDSPQEVFKAAQKAGAKKDFSTLSKLVAPSEQPMLAFGTDMAVGMFVEFYEGEKAPKLQKTYQKIQQKYKIKSKDEDDSETLKITQNTPQEVIDAHMLKRAKKLYGHVDAANYVPDLMGIIVNMPEMADQTFVSQEKLADLKIDGDHATGTAGGKNIYFLREGGRWYLTAGIMD